MRFTETVLETYTYGVIGRSHRLSPLITAPPPSPHISPLTSTQPPPPPRIPTPAHRSSSKGHRTPLPLPLPPPNKLSTRSLSCAQKRSFELHHLGSEDPQVGLRSVHCGVLFWNGIPPRDFIHSSPCTHISQRDQHTNG